MDFIDDVTPLEGEAVHVAIRVVDTAASKGASLRCRAVNPTLLELCAQSDAAGQTATDTTVLQVDSALDDVETSAAQVAAALMPTALSICSAVGHAVVACTRTSALDSSYSLFDPTARHSCALHLISSVAGECRKLGQTCTLSMGVIDETMTTVLDLLLPSGDGRATQAARTRFRPSVLDHTLFPDMTQVDIVRDKRPQEVLRSGLDAMRRTQDRHTCDVFAIVTMPVGAGSACLYIVDIASPKRLRFAAAQHPELACLTTMASGSEAVRAEMTLPCLLFGAAAAARTTLLHCVPRLLCPEDASGLRCVAMMRKLVGFPKAAKKSQSGLQAHACDLASEVLRLKRRVNEIGTHLAKQSGLAAHAQQQSQDFEMCLRKLRTVEGVLATNLPLAIDEQTRFNDDAAIVLRARLGLLTQLEDEIRTKEASLDEYRDWLLQVPVAETHGNRESIVQQDRIKVLEKTVEMQSAEVVRLRRVINRDMTVLRSEFDVLRKAAEMKTPLECVFRTSLETFAQEATLLAKSDPDLALARAELAISELAARLQHDAALFFGASDAQHQLGQSEACTLLFKAAVDKLRRSMGFALEPPAEFSSCGLETWRSVVLEKYACTLERHRLRCLAEGLVLQCDRLQEAVDSAMSAATQRQPVKPLRSHGLVERELTNSGTASTLAAGEPTRSLCLVGARLQKCQGIVAALQGCAAAVERHVGCDVDGAATGDQAADADLAQFLLQRHTHVAHTTMSQQTTAADDAPAEFQVRLEEIVDSDSRKMRVAARHRGDAGLRATGVAKQGQFSTLIEGSSIRSARKPRS